MHSQSPDDTVPAAASSETYKLGEDRSELIRATQGRPGRSPLVASGPAKRPGLGQGIEGREEVLERWH
jgi:hypothetical protein